MYLNEQFADQLVGIVAVLVIVAVGLALSRWQSLKHQRQMEDLRLANLALVNSLEQLTAQTARDIERKAQPPPQPESATAFCHRMRNDIERTSQSHPSMKDAAEIYKDRMAKAQAQHPEWPWSDMQDTRVTGPLPEGVTFVPGDPISQFQSEADIHGGGGEREFSERFIRPMVEAAVDRAERAYGVTLGPDGKPRPYDPVAWAAAHKEGV